MSVWLKGAFQYVNVIASNSFICQEKKDCPIMPKRKLVRWSEAGYVFLVPFNTVSCISKPVLSVCQSFGRNVQNANVSITFLAQVIYQNGRTSAYVTNRCISSNLTITDKLQ